MAGPYNINNKVDDSQLATAATANSVAQRTSDGSLNVTDLNASRNAFIGTTDSNSARLTATSGSGSCIYGNSVSVFSRESGTATQSIIGMNQTGVDAPFIDFRKDGVTVGNIGTSSGDIYFGSGSSGTERMRIDSSGNVGIGTSSPSARLEVNTPDFQQMILRRGITGDGAGILSFVQGNGTAAGHVGGLTGGGLQFRTGDSAGTERMRITSSGNVGIGTGSPAGKLDVTGSNGKLILNNGNTAGGVKISAFNAAGNANGYLAFEGFSSEYMRIDSSGNVLVGKTSQSVATAGAELQSGTGANAAIVGTASVNPLILNRLSTDGSIASLRKDNVTVGSIAVTGSSTSYNTSSDYRLKEDWQPMVGNIDRLMQLKPCNFAWKINGSRVDGFLAHEAQEVVPEAVTGEKDAVRTEQYEVEPAVYEDVVIPAEFDEEGNEVSPERTEQKLVSEAVMGEREVPEYQGIDQAKLVPLLTAALQDAIKKIEALEARIEALEEK